MIGVSRSHMIRTLHTRLKLLVAVWCVYGAQLGQVTAALLLVEAALPEGCMRDRDEWGRVRSEYWEANVVTATSPQMLMEAVLVLEDSLRSDWILPAASVVNVLKPTRTWALTNATVPSVAWRIWALDASLQYDRVSVNGRLRTRGGNPRLAQIRGDSGDVKVLKSTCKTVARPKPRPTTTMVGRTPRNRGGSHSSTAKSSTSK